MKKKTILEEILNKYYDGMYTQIRFSDLPKDLKDTDIIDIHRHEPYYSENQSYEDYTELLVFREREETDEEFYERVEHENRREEEIKQRRLERYLKLKEEFEKNY